MQNDKIQKWQNTKKCNEWKRKKIQMEQNTNRTKCINTKIQTQQIQKSKIQTWQNAKIPKYKYAKIQKDKIQIVKIQM